jgi:hypothetical protein
MNPWLDDSRLATRKETPRTHRSTARSMIWPAKFVTSTALGFSHRPWMCEASGYDKPSRMWTVRLEVGVHLALCAAVLSAACSEPELNQSAPLDYTAARAEPASTQITVDERRRQDERMGILDLHGSSTWFERKRPEAEFPNLRWATNCSIHLACPAPRAMPECKADEHAQSWEALRGQAKQLSGSVVAINGQLDLIAETVLVPIACRLGACCHHIGSSVVLDNRGNSVELESSEHALGLAGYECHGDDSKGCCNVIADGRTVIARGRLVESAGRGESREPPWELREASLCTLAAARAAKR